MAPLKNNIDINNTSRRVKMSYTYRSLYDDTTASLQLSELSYFSREIIYD